MLGLIASQLCCVLQEVLLVGGGSPPGCKTKSRFRRLDALLGCLSG